MATSMREGRRTETTPPRGREPTVERFMTPAPHTINAEESLATAHQLMRKHGIRHLPVLEHGLLVGLVSQRDLYLLETLAGADPGVIAVLEAMTPDPYRVAPATPVAEVARGMVARHYGSAVVVEDDRLVGIFTTSDALRALIAALDRRGG
jgi:acetoin utilization protein AcuB